MSKFTPEEIEYLQNQRLGRLATVDKQGDPHVVPVGFRYNPETDSIDIGGYNMAASKKYRDAVRHGRAAFVVDDVAPPWKPRMLEVRGSVEGVVEGAEKINQNQSAEILRITPTHIISFGLTSDMVPGEEGKMEFSSRKVG